MTEHLLALDAERAVLGAALLDSTALALLLTEIPDAQLFQAPEHRVIHRAFADLAGRGEPLTPETIRSACQRLKLDVSLEVLGELVDAVPTAANLPFHAAIVRDRASRLSAHSALLQAAAQAADLSRPLSDTAQAAATALTAPPVSPKRMTLAGLVGETMQNLEDELRGGLTPGIPIGLSRLDSLTRGWQPGHVIVVAARPSVGKTQFAGYATREACRADIPTLLVTAEMSSRQIVRRLVAMESGIDLLRLADQPHGFDSQASHLAKAAGQVASWPLEIDSHAATPGMVRIAAERTKREYGSLGLIVVDYVQLLHADGRPENRNLEVGHVMRGLQRLAHDLEVPVIALSQLSRDIEKGDGKREPRLSDLRDSGEIEQAADLVLFLHPQDQDDTGLTHRKTILILAKNRHGRRGRVLAELDLTTGRWQEPKGVAWAA